MPEDGRDAGRWIQELSARLVSEQLRSLERYAELLRRVARGELNEKTVRQEYLRFAKENVGGYVRSLASLSVSYQSSLLDLGRAYEERFLDRMLDQDGQDGQAGQDGAGSGGRGRRIEIPLSAPIGEEASAAFVIENERPEPAEISFIVSEFTGPEGEAPFRPPLRLEPARFSLGPREEQRVTLRLPLLADLFLAGRPYTATVAVRGHNDLELALSVVAEQPVAGADPPTKRPRARGGGAAAETAAGKPAAGTAAGKRAARPRAAAKRATGPDAPAPRAGSERKKPPTRPKPGRAGGRARDAR